MEVLNMLKLTQSKLLICLMWLCLLTSSLITFFYQRTGLVMSVIMLVPLLMLCFSKSLPKMYKNIYINQLSTLVIYLLFVIASIVFVYYKLILLAALALLSIKFLFSGYCLLSFFQALFTSKSNLLADESGF
jgi:hypothetical protein